jgi:hypothetical protein
MKGMRFFAAAAFAALALVAAGCGASVSSVASGAASGTGAANLVPADADAFAAVNTDLGSDQWQRVDALTKDFPAHAKLLDQITSELQKHGLTWKDDVEPALGPEADVALLGKDDVVFTKPDDKDKLRTLAEKLSTSDEHYTVEEIGGWSVVADAQDVFARVRAAENGQSLADADTFSAAWAQLGADALVRAYATGNAAASMPRIVKPGDKVQWLTARVWADGDALRAELTAKPSGALPATTTQPLLRDVPSGAALAVAFHGSADLAQKLSAAASKAAGGGVPLVGDLATLANSDGVLYARSAGLLPEVALELSSKNPQKALTTARGALGKLGGSLGPVPLTAQLSNGKVVISDGPSAVAALRSGPKLTGDAAYKNAVKSAGVPARTSFLVYADVTQLAPFVQVLAGALGGTTGQPDPALGENLTHLGTVVAWATTGGGLVRLGAWLQPR